MWRLQPRGAANRGVAVDADGAMLGPDCPLVQRTASGFRAARREPVCDVQRLLLPDKDDPNWLYRQSQRIAEALDRGEIALAQIYGLRIPVRDLDGFQLKQLGALAPLAKAGFNPDEPRVPAAQPGGGEWTTGEDTGATGANFTLDALNAGDGNQDATPAIAWHLRPPSSGSPGEDASAAEAAKPETDAPASATASRPPYSEVPPVAPSPHLVGGRWPAPTGTNANPLLHPAQAEENENSRGGGPFFDLDPLRDVRLERFEWLRRQLEDLEPANRALERLTSPDHSPTWADINELDVALRDAQERAGAPPSTKWELGWGARGSELELQRLGGKRKYPPNMPIIDHFTEAGTAISIKSIDLNASWYRDPINLSRRIDQYVDKLMGFEGLDWGRTEIRPDEIREKVLDIIVPKNSGTATQREAITRSTERAERLGVHVLISRY